MNCWRWVRVFYVYTIDRRPGEPVSRQWHAYLILHDAYIQDIPNRAVMAHPYISEETFHFARRAALHSVARAFEEMEAALH